MSFIGQTTIAVGSPDLVLPNVPCDSAVTVGDWVRMESGLAVKALADGLDNSNILGLVESKAGSAFANVRVLGVTAPIFSGLDETKEYYLSDVTAGDMDVSVPTASGHVVLKVGQPYSDTQFLVLKGIRMVRS